MSTLLRTPLAATAAVIAGLLLLAVPLRLLTNAQPAPASTAATATTESPLVPAWITLKLLAAAEVATLRTTTGDTLLTLDAPAAGDHERRIELPLADGHCELILEVVRGGDAPETAAFLTVTPDGMEARKAHTIGSGTLHDLFELNW